MKGEFENRIRKVTNNKASEELVEMVNSARAEFPCITCSSNQECDSFKWFTKWFGNQKVP